MSINSNWKQINSVNAYRVIVDLTEQSSTNDKVTINYALKLQSANGYSFSQYYLGYYLKVGDTVLANLPYSTSNGNKTSIGVNTEKTFASGTATIAKADGNLAVTAYIETAATNTTAPKYFLPGKITLSGTFNTNAATYTITFDANQGTGGPGTLIKTYGVDLTIPKDKIPYRTGYVFKEWNAAADGSGTLKNPGNTIVGNRDLTMYAIWTPATYTVTYNANGGTVSPASKIVTYNSTYGTLATPTRIGYVFNGWYTKATGGTQVTSSTKVTTAKNHNIYAQWIAKQLTIIFHKNDNSNDTFTQIVTAGENDRFGYENGSYRWPDVEDTYEFGHWYKSSNFRIHGWNRSSDGTAEEGKLYATRSVVADKFIDDKCPQATNTIDLYAKWDTIGKYKVGAQWKDCAIRVLYNDKWKQCVIKEI